MTLHVSSRRPATNCYTNACQRSMPWRRCSWRSSACGSDARRFPTTTNCWRNDEFDICCIDGGCTSFDFGHGTEYAGDHPARRNQEKLIEQGLKSGELTTKEAAKLERDETRVDKMESK